jgi:methionine-rich copper-binding protein CopC
MTKVSRVAFALSFIALCGSAFAHAKLRSSTPANNATVAIPPTSLTLVFNEDVRLAMLKLATDSKQILISVDPNAAATPTITAKLPPLPPGKYQVNWSALSPNDGHIAKGSFSFSIASPK